MVVSVRLFVRWSVHMCGVETFDQYIEFPPCQGFKIGPIEKSLDPCNSFLIPLKLLYRAPLNLLILILKFAEGQGNTRALEKTTNLSFYQLFFYRPKYA